MHGAYSVKFKYSFEIFAVGAI
jgi:hypothetical protein